jgi:hypothetical protein
MPPMPPSAFSSWTSAIIVSVVSIRPAIEAAFCRAVRVTFAGSMTPAATRSSYFSVAALKPNCRRLLYLTDYHRAFHTGDVSERLFVPVKIPNIQLLQS